MTDDVRIVIDVSGSMVDSDPQNLRVPALRMLNGMIPTGARAGVWTFGRYANMEVKWGPVNDQWRRPSLHRLLNRNRKLWQSPRIEITGMRRQAMPEWTRLPSLQRIKLR